MRSSSTQLARCILSRSFTLSLIIAIITLLPIQAVLSKSGGQEIHRLQARSPAGSPSPKTEVVQCGLAFVPGFGGVGIAGCKAFGGQRYVCTASCTVTRDDKSANADGGMTFKNCQMYTDRMGESELDSAKVDVVVSNLYSYYHQATVTIRKQTSKTTATQRVVTWPERVDVMGYKANTPHDGKPLSLYQCPLSDKANLPRPWCRGCTPTEAGTF